MLFLPALMYKGKWCHNQDSFLLNIVSTYKEIWKVTCTKQDTKDGEATIDEQVASPGAEMKTKGKPENIYIPKNH